MPRPASPAHCASYSATRLPRLSKTSIVSAATGAAVEVATSIVMQHAMIACYAPVSSLPIRLAAGDPFAAGQ